MSRDELLWPSLAADLTDEKTETNVVALLPPGPFLQMAEEERGGLRDRGRTMTFGFGQIVAGGEAGADRDHLWVVLKGRCRVVQARAPREMTLAILGPGDLFDPQAELSAPIALRAMGPATMMQLDRAALAESPSLFGGFRAAADALVSAEVMRRSTIFGALSEPELAELATSFCPVQLDAGRTVYRRGDDAGPLFLLKRGQLEVVVETPDGPVTARYLRPGDVCGAHSCAKRRPREETIVARSDATLLALAHQPLAALCRRSDFVKSAIDRTSPAGSTPAAPSPAPLPLDFASAGKVEAIAPRTAPAAKERVDPGEPEPTAEDPFRSSGGYFTTRARKIGRFPFIRQTDQTDCGVACLAMIARYYGRRISTARIRSLASADADGVTLGGLCRAAGELGLAARPARVSQRHLEKIPFPAVVHYLDSHWMVLLGVEKDRVRVANPALGIELIPREEFLAGWNGYTALFDFTEAFAKDGDDPSSFGWFVQYVRPFASVLTLMLALALVVASLTSAIPIFTQVIVDRVVVDDASDLLTTILVVLGVISLLLAGSRALQGYLLAFVAVRVDAAVFDYLARRLLALPMAYFYNRRLGDLQRRLGGARELREFALRGSIQGLLAVVQIAVVLVLMFIYSQRLALAFAAVTPLYVGLMVLAVRRLRPLYSDLEGQLARYHSDQLDAIKGIESVKASSSELRFRSGLLDRFLRSAQSQFRFDYGVIGYDACLQLVGYLSQIAFLYVGATSAMRGEISLGGFVAFNSLVAMVNAPIVTCLLLWEDAQRCAVLAHRLADVFETDPEQGQDRDALMPVATLSGAVTLRDVGFHYGEPESDSILRSVHLEVQPGEVIALVGRSGSGKSTFARLLVGLLTPTEGSISFDGIDSRLLNHRDLRRRIGFVLQENHVFSGTVLENIALDDEPDLGRAIAAAQGADAHRFILNLPLGYSTRLGETGIRLSGGQVQRLAIARALYKNPSIFIFDEATSALDGESEELIQTNLVEHFRGRTVFLIAHRLSTIQNADRIIVLENGEIVEQGSHAELMDRRGFYHQLAARQQVVG